MTLSAMHGRLVRAFFLLLGLLGFATASYAHPMGNFSINHYTRITIEGNSIQVQYFIDMAEIPTYQELQDAGLQANEQGSKLAAYLEKKSAALQKGLLVEVDGRRITLEGSRGNAIFPPGAGGLPTMKVGFVYSATLPAGSASAHSLHYIDSNFPGRAGWKEVVADAEKGSSLLNSSVPSKDRSAQLSNYPTDLLNSPPQNLEASLTFNIPTASPEAVPSQALATTSIPVKVPLHAGTNKASLTGNALSPTATVKPISKKTIVAPPPVPLITPQPHPISATDGVVLSANRQATPRSAFTELITRQDLSLWFLFTAALIAMFLGALHAIEPGHGKTLVAAYLVGSRGKARHAVMLGIIVTLAHTAGVFALGLITLYASHYIVPEKLYPWLGVISGISITGLALLMLLRRLAEGQSAEEHAHWYERFTKSSASTRPTSSASEGPVSLRQLLLLGITGGLVPCPAALVVLLSALSLHRIGFGLFLIVCFSMGLAAVLVGIGLMMVYAGRVMKKRFKQKSPLVTRWLPLLSSGFMIFLGLALTLQSFRTTGIALDLTHMFDGRFMLLLLLGIFLGMRHSTDPDHVVAVTTIVTRLRSIRQAGVVGLLWGVGHTFTIFVVGSAIILFGVTIPPRIGLSMEFGVALMLILLGVLNLTGVMKRITSRFTYPEFRQALVPAMAAQAAAGQSFTLDRSEQMFTVAPIEKSYQPLISAGANIPVPANKTAKGLRQLYGEFGPYHLVRPLIIGTVHGLAGSAAVALLVLATIKNPVWAIAYLLLFGAGTMVGMALMTALIALPIVWSGRRLHNRIPQFMGVASGVVSLAFGMVLVYQIGYIDGLFRTVPNWTPH